MRPTGGPYPGYVGPLAYAAYYMATPDGGISFNFRPIFRLSGTPDPDRYHTALSVRMRHGRYMKSLNAFAADRYSAETSGRIEQYKIHEHHEQAAQH
jgi:hypothetical protein